MKKRTKRKLNKKFYILIIIILVIIIGLYFLLKNINYKKTYDYKLHIRGYQEEQINVLKKELKNDELDKLLKLEFIDYIDKLIKEKYFLFKNIDKYIETYNEDVTLSKLVALVNTKANNEYYTDVTSTDTSKGELMLVNKYNTLSPDYIPKNLHDISNWYSYGENSSVEKVYDQFIDMHLAAKEKGLFIIVNSSYRSFELQTEIYEDEKFKNGVKFADSFVAHPGHSEHQTGYTLDISDGVAIEEDFENTDEFKWLSSNAHKYGFILRYPKEFEDITGFGYEPWHYRYIGVKHATELKKLGITFDEYYAYYLDK